MKHIAFVMGEPEYRSLRTLPGIAQELATRHGCRTTLCPTSVVNDAPDYQSSEFDGLDCLGEVDLMVIYTRFRVLGDHQMKLIKAYLDSGRPVVGLRTSTHAFHFPVGSAWASWNDGFGRDVLGTPWISHHGNCSRTDVSVIDAAAEHPILVSVEKRFEVRSWLYNVLPLAKDCDELLWGQPVQPQIDPQENPVAWTTEHNGARVFYTSLGHPEDFEVGSVRTLVINGIRWALGDCA